MTPSYQKFNYRLRPAKNIERKMMSELFERLQHFAPLREYQYVGFGSIYFADYALFHKRLGIGRMISIEGNVKDEERVRFNSPYRFIDIRMGLSFEVLPHV